MYFYIEKVRNLVTLVTLIRTNTTRKKDLVSPGSEGELIAI